VNQAAQHPCHCRWQTAKKKGQAAFARGTAHKTLQIAPGNDKKHGRTSRMTWRIAAGNDKRHGGTSRMTLQIAAGNDKSTSGLPA
jgi:hypothetical protein